MRLAMRKLWGIALLAWLAGVAGIALQRALWRAIWQQFCTGAGRIWSIK